MSEQGIKPPVETEQLGAAVIDTPAPAPTLREEVSHAFKAIKEAPEGETAEAREARIRDEQGRFAEKGKEAKPARPVLTAKPKEVTPVAAAPGTAAAPAAVKPPDGWSAEMKAEFTGLNPKVQSEIIRRETEMHRQFTTQDQDRTLGKSIREVAGPYLATIKAEGGDEKAAFGAFLNYAHIMRTGSPQQKLAALHTVAQQYNVPLGSQLQQAPQNQAFESLQQRIDRLESERQADIQQRQVQEQSALTGEIEAFKAEPGHEHFETVRSVMGTLMQLEGGPKTLQEAYDQAIWANPEIRSDLTAKTLSEAEGKRLTEIQGKTGAAKWAAGSITGGPGGMKAPNGSGVERSLGDELRANLRAATGRV